MFFTSACIYELTTVTSYSMLLITFVLVKAVKKLIVVAVGYVVATHQKNLEG